MKNYLDDIAGHSCSGSSELTRDLTCDLFIHKKKTSKWPALSWNTCELLNNIHNYDCTFFPEKGRTQLSVAAHSRY